MPPSIAAFLLPGLGHWRAGRREQGLSILAATAGIAQDPSPAAPAAQQPAKPTRSLADGLVLARSALHHSMNYRSVVIYGRFEAVTEPAYKLASLRAFIDGLYPGRWDTLRPINDKELNATTVLRIALDEASAKVRDWGVKDDEEDLEWPVWAGVIPLRTETGAPEIEHDSVGRVVPPTRFG